MIVLWMRFLAEVCFCFRQLVRKSFEFSRVQHLRVSGIKNLQFKSSIWDELVKFVWKFSAGWLEKKLNINFILAKVINYIGDLIFFFEQNQSLLRSFLKSHFRGHSLKNISTSNFWLLPLLTKIFSQNFPLPISPKIFSSYLN